jgi:nitric oxide reductase activation protein
MRRSLRSKKSSVLLLLDLSASVADRIPGSALSILDIEKQAAILIADMALEIDDRIAIHGFSSDTRAGVHYYHFLDFGQVLTFDVQEQLERVKVFDAHGCCHPACPWIF